MIILIGFSRTHHTSHNNDLDAYSFERKGGGKLHKMSENIKVQEELDEGLIGTVL